MSTAGVSTVLDVVLAIVLLAALVRGYQVGFLRSLGALVGIAVGAVAAVLLAPIIGSFVPQDPWRVIATAGAAIVLIVLGHTVGAGIGGIVGSPLRRTPLGTLDRLLGAVASLVVRALVLTTLASVVVALGVPFLAQPIAGSVVLRTIDAATPQPLDSALAQLRSMVVASGIPELGIAVGGGTQTGTVPSVDTDTAALRRAAASVVKITGRAPACSQQQSGSGFVVANDRVLTNAHVLAGVSDPVVTAPNGQAIVGKVVLFDASSDLAVIVVPGLRAKALPLAPTVQMGDQGVVDGYPFGGPFTSGGARVLRTGTTRVADVGGGGTSARALATLAADVEQGNSGGPLLDASGRVLGVVFAKSSQTADLGYALTRDEFGAAVRRAHSLTDAVGTGACERG